MADTWQSLLRKMQARRVAIAPAMQKATGEATRLVWERSKAHMRQDIYGKPIPKRPRSGKPKWRRTSNLRKSEKKRMLSAYEGIVQNPAKAKAGGGGYAHARHNLGLAPGHPDVIPPPPKRKRKTDRVAPFRARAIRETATRRRQIYRRHLLQALRQAG